MANTNQMNEHPLLVEQKPKNHNAAIIAMIVMLAVVLIGAVAFRGMTGKSVAANVDPLSPVPAVAE